MKSLDYMKLIVLCTLLVANSTFAQNSGPSRLVRCLAQEEALLHKQKRSGPQYKLNQLFFNEWSGNPSLELKDLVYDRVCEPSPQRASIRLLREFLLNGQKIFKSYSAAIDDPVANMRKVMLQELRRQMPQVFFTYVADIENFAPTHNCLENAVPVLASLRENYRYLESEISLEFMESYKSQWKQAFDGVENWQEHFSRCQKSPSKKSS